MTDPVGVSVLWDDKNFKRGVIFYLNAMTRMQKESLKASQAITASSKKSGDAIKKTGRDAQRASKSFNKGLRNMSLAAKQLLPVLGLVGAARAVERFVSSSLDEFVNFEKGMAEVFTLVPFLSESAMSRMELDMLKFGVAQARLTDETVPALYQAISAGVPPDNVMSFMETASIAARGGVTDLKTSVDVLTTVVNAYGREAIDAERAADIMFAAVQGGKLTFTELAKTAFNVIPVAASLGVKFEDVAAAIAAMTKQGVPARTATTQLRQVLINISQDGREAAEVFEQFSGKTFADFIAEGNNMKDAMEVIQIAAEELGVTSADLFGNIRAGQGALVLTGEGLELYATEMERAINSTDAMDVASATMEQTLQFNRDEAAAATEQYKILVGEGLGPAEKAWNDLKIAVFGAGTEAAIAKKEQEILNQEYLEAPHTIDQLTNRLEGYRKAQEDLAAAQFDPEDDRSFRVLSGEMEALDEGMAQVIKRIISMSTSTSLARKNIEAATGMTMEWNGAQEKFIMTSEDRGTILKLTNKEFVELLGSMENLTYAELQNVLATNAQTEADLASAEARRVQDEALEKLMNTTSAYLVKMLESEDVQGSFNDLLLELGATGEYTVDEMIELAESTGEYTDEQLEAARVMGQVKKRQLELIDSMEEEGRGHMEIVQILQDEFGEKIANAQATLELTEATDGLTEAEEEQAKAREENRQRVADFKAETGGLFSEIISGKDEVGLFTSAIEGLGTQWVRVGGRTREQNRVLGELNSQYERADETVRDYQGGVRGLMMSDDERNGKIAEQTELMGALGGKIGELQSITGSLVQVYVPAILNQETMNEALFKSAEDAGASAWSLAALGVALGQFTEEEAEAALKAAAMQSRIAELGKEIADGTMTFDEAIVRMRQFADNIDEEYTAQLTLKGPEAKDIDKLTRDIEETVRGAEEGAKDINKAYDRLGTGVNKNLGIIGADLGTFSDNVGATSQEVIDSAQQLEEDATTHWGQLADNYAAGAMDVADEMATINEAKDAVRKDHSKGMLMWIGENETLFEQLAGKSIDAYAGKMEEFPDATGEAIDDAVKEGEEKVPQFTDLGADIIAGMVAGIEANADSVADALGNVVDQAVARGEQAAEAASPSKRMFRLGRDIMFGLWMGIARHRREAIVTAEDFIGLLMQEFEELGPQIQRIASDFQLYALTDITEEFFTALSDQLGISSGDLEDYADMLNNTLIPALEAWWTEMDRITTLAGALSSAGDTFADLFTQQTLDPIQELMDGIDEQSGGIIQGLQDLFDLSDEEILAQIPELLAYAQEQGYDDVVDQLMTLRDLQDERNAAEEQFIKEQERILELQKQQQQLSFLQAQLDLMRSLEEAGLDPAEVLGGITLGLDASLPDLIEAMTAAMNTLLGVVDEELQIASPSKVFVEYGRQIMAGLGKGILGGSQDIKIMVEDVFRQTIPTSIPAISISSPIVNVPVPAASSSISNNYYFGDTHISDQMDAALFEEQIRTIVANEV